MKLSTPLIGCIIGGEIECVFEGECIRNNVAFPESHIIKFTTLSSFDRESFIWYICLSFYNLFQLFSCDSYR